MSYHLDGDDVFSNTSLHIPNTKPMMPLPPPKAETLSISVDDSESSDESLRPNQRRRRPKKSTESHHAPDPPNEPIQSQGPMNISESGEEDTTMEDISDVNTKDQRKRLYHYENADTEWDPPRHTKLQERKLHQRPPPGTAARATNAFTKKFIGAKEISRITASLASITEQHDILRSSNALVDWRATDADAQRARVQSEKSRNLEVLVSRLEATNIMKSEALRNALQAKGTLQTITELLDTPPSAGTVTQSTFQENLEKSWKSLEASIIDLLGIPFDAARAAREVSAQNTLLLKGIEEEKARSKALQQRVNKLTQRSKSTGSRPNPLEDLETRNKLDSMDQKLKAANEEVQRLRLENIRLSASDQDTTERFTTVLDRQQDNYDQRVEDLIKQHGNAIAYMEAKNAQVQDELDKARGQAIRDGERIRMITQKVEQLEASQSASYELHLEEQRSSKTRYENEHIHLNEELKVLEGNLRDANKRATEAETRVSEHRLLRKEAVSFEEYHQVKERLAEVISDAQREKKSQLKLLTSQSQTWLSDFESLARECADWRYRADRAEWAVKDLRQTWYMHARGVNIDKRWQRHLQNSQDDWQECMERDMASLGITDELDVLDTGSRNQDGVAAEEKESGEELISSGDGGVLAQSRPEERPAMARSGSSDYGDLGSDFDVTLVD